MKISVIAKTLEKEPSSLYNSTYTKHAYATRVQNTTIYSDGTTHIKQHRSDGVQPNGSPCGNNHCSSRHELSFRHNKHTHTYQKAATGQIYQPQSLSSWQTTSSEAKTTQHSYKSHILTMSIQNWRSTRWRPFTNTIVVVVYPTPPCLLVGVLPYFEVTGIQFRFPR